MHWSQFSSDKYYIVPFPSGRLQSSLFFFVSSFPQLCGVLCMASRRLEGRQIGPVSSVRGYNPDGREGIYILGREGEGVFRGGWRQKGGAVLEGHYIEQVRVTIGDPQG